MEVTVGLVKPQELLSWTLNRDYGEAKGIVKLKYMTEYI